MAAALTKSQPLGGDTAGPVDVVFFGWADCQPSHVAKYVTLYPEGSNSLVIPSKLSDFFLRSTTSLATSHAHVGPVLAFLRQHGHLHDPVTPRPQPSVRPLVLHVFSNGGVLSLLTTLLAISHSGQTLTQPIAAMILDSAPNPRTRDALGESAEVMTLALPRPLQALVRPLVHGVLLAFHLVVHRCLGVRPRLDVNCDALLVHPDLVRVPKLVLYSLGDRLVRPWHVERFLSMLVPAMDVLPGTLAQETKECVVAYSVVDNRVQSHATVEDVGTHAAIDRSVPHGGLVSVVRFPKDSPHVQHFRKYPAEYLAAVSRFVTRTR